MKANLFTKKAISAVLSAVMLFSAGIYTSVYAENTTENTVQTLAANVSITESGGWHESAYAVWSPYQGAEGYNVYVKAENGEYTKIDDELVREYTTYFRADALGLAAGSYTMKIVPVVSGAEDTAAAAETSVLTVDNYLREGFAFSAQSPAGYTTGAYNKDGTLRADADVIYLTDANRDTVTLNGDSSKGVGINEIMAKRKGDTPLAVRVIGRVRKPDGINVDSTLRVQDKQNVTFEGVGKDATLYGWGLSVKRTQNMEFRNMGIMWHCQGSDGDAISFDTENFNIFVHNMDFYYGAPGEDADQKKGDGTVDMKQMTDYVTISYNHFYDTGKSTFSGGQWELNNKYDPRAKVNVTYHHNYFDYADSRHPRCVVGNTHVYNNYYVGNGYGAAACENASLFVENNYFENCAMPMMIGSQGSDAYRNGTFSGSKNLSNQDGGMIKEYGNYITGQDTFFNQYNTPVEGQIDAYTVASRDEKVPETVTAMKGGWAHNNFDTEPTFYSYTPDTAEDAKANVMAGAGRMNGGDLTWTFSPSDAKNGNIIEGLLDKIKNYSNDLVKAGGEAAEGEEPTTQEPTSEVTTETPKEGQLKDDIVYDLSTLSTDKSAGIWFGEKVNTGSGKNTYYSEDGYSYEIDGYYTSDNNPKITDGIPESGCFLGITAPGNGVITVALRTGSNKTSYVTCDGETIKEISNAGASSNRFDAISFNVIEGKDYYIYTAGSKARFAYLGFTGSSSEPSTEPPTEPTEPPTDPTEPSTEPTEPTEPETMLWGDADNNKQINIIDAMLTLRYTLVGEKAGIEENVLPYLDIDKSGKVNSTDVAMILQNVLDNTFDIGNN